MPDVTKVRSLGGGAILALVIIAVAALILAIFSFGGGHLEAAAIGLLASAVAFSGIANVIFRS